MSDPTTTTATTTRAVATRPVETPVTTQPVPAPGRLRPLRAGFYRTRLRILAFIVGLLVLAIAATLVIERGILLRRLDDEISVALEQEAQELARLAQGVDPETALPFGTDIESIFEVFFRRNLFLEGEAGFAIVGQRPFLQSPDAPYDLVRTDPDLLAYWNAVDEAEFGEIDTPAGPVRYLAQPIFDEPTGERLGLFIISIFLAGERGDITESLRIQAAVSLAVLLVGAAAAWGIAGRLLQPVREVTEAARTITETDLSRRIAVKGHDEIGEVALTFNGMLDRLDQAFATQRAFVDDAGHELRTPITIIQGHLELMSDDPDEQEETLALVQDELDRMARIVNDLLLLAKAERPDFLRLEPVDLRELLDDVKTKSMALGDRGWLVEGPAELHVVADPDRLTQALLNLTNNALRHTAEGTPVSLTLAAGPSGEARISVHDEGPGIPADEQPRIFERFARGHFGPRRSDGAGLGLSIVRAIVEGHGGRIELDSGPGRGTTFTLVLPPGSPTPADPDHSDPKEP